MSLLLSISFSSYSSTSNPLSLFIADTFHPFPMSRLLLTPSSTPTPFLIPYRTDALSTQMTQRVKSSDMMLRKSFSRTLMSRSHLHSPTKEKDPHTAKDDNGIFIVISCFDEINEQFQFLCFTEIKNTSSQSKKS